MEKKYEFSDETLEYKGHTLHRIIALIDFDSVLKGEVGGWIENKSNLSQYGNCWVYDDAKVYDDAIIEEGGSVIENAEVCENAEVSGNALVGKNAIVSGKAIVCGNAIVYGNAQVTDLANIRDYAKIEENALICGNASVLDNSVVMGNVFVDSVPILGRPVLLGNAVIKHDDDYMVFKNFWSSGRVFNWTKSDNMWKVGCFYGTGEELIKKAYEDSEESGRNYERIVKYVDEVVFGIEPIKKTKGYIRHFFYSIKKLIKNIRK